MVDIRAFKESETGDYYVIRLQELSGKDLKQVELSLAAKDNLRMAGRRPGKEDRRDSRTGRKTGL